MSSYSQILLNDLNSFFLRFIYFKNYMYACVCVEVCVLPVEARRRYWILLELELQEVVSCPTWVVERKLRSFVRSADAPYH